MLLLFSSEPVSETPYEAYRSQNTGGRVLECPFCPDLSVPESEDDSSIPGKNRKHARQRLLSPQLPLAVTKVIRPRFSEVRCVFPCTVQKKKRTSKSDQF